LSLARVQASAKIDTLIHAARHCGVLAPRTRPKSPAVAYVKVTPTGRRKRRAGRRKVPRETQYVPHPVRPNVTPILCLGMSALDAIYRVAAIPTQPTKILATGFTESGGGMAANASVAVARL